MDSPRMRGTGLLWIFVLISVEFIQFSSCQFGPLRASTDNLTTRASVGDSAVLTCSSETGVPLGICLWERKNQGMSANNNGSDTTNLLITFNVLTSRPDRPSGTEGYLYAGEGLLKGNCGLKISKVKEADYTAWQCTLVGESKVYRESIKLQRTELEVPTTRPVTETTAESAVASGDEREAKEFEFTVGTGSVSEPNKANKAIESMRGRPRPVITAGSVGDTELSRAFGQSVSSAPSGSQVQEVQVQSAGLVIIPRKSRKLVILE